VSLSLVSLRLRALVLDSSSGLIFIRNLFQIGFESFQVGAIRNSGRKESFPIDITSSVFISRGLLRPQNFKK
jgi:hypothetical protein